MPSSASALLTSYHPPPSGVLPQSGRPSHSTSTEFSQSSPVNKLAKNSSNHNCNEVQAFACDEDVISLRYNEQTPFLEFLNVPHERLLKIPKVKGQTTLDTFVKVANTIAKSIKELYFANKDTLVFKFTKSQSHGGHITATSCKPDYTAAFKSDWGDKDTTLWPCIRLVGEKASQGKKHEDQERQAILCLYYLLLARPDLHVAQGLFTSKSNIVFLFGIGGVGIRTFSVEWGNAELHRLMYAFFYRLYDPGDFADSSYVEMVPNLEESTVTYNVQIHLGNGMDRNPMMVTNLRPLYASNPFASRTHILSNPNSKVKVNGKPLTVLKDQLCRIGTCFDEHNILTAVHSPETVPGIVEAVHNEVIKIPRDFCSSREKHRLGLRQVGKPLTSIPTVAQMLEIVFDTLEVLRYLRFERHVLHRDISKGNILYVDDNLSSSAGSQSGGANKMLGPEGLPLCFINYVLGKSNDPKKTSMLLIDFNHAEHLESKWGPEHKQIPQTGTPGFIARAVELGRPVSPGNDMLYIPEVPRSAECYGTCHPDRVKKFPHSPHKLSPISMDGTDRQWRHELHHDAESVFWVLLYWIVGAQPENEEKEPIATHIWTGLTGTVTSRIHLLRGGLHGATHSVYRPLWPMLNKLAHILNADGHWVESSDPRTDPGYINEAFQRLVLQFILEHRNEPFMQHRVESQPRRPEEMSQFLSRSSDFSRKRSLSESTIPSGTKRLHMVKDSPEKDVSEDQFVGEEEQWVGADSEE